MTEALATSEVTTGWRKGVRTTTLADAIAESLGRLGRFGVSYPVYLDRPPGHEIVAADEVLAPQHLGRYFERSIMEWTDHPDEEDVRAAASRFVRRYCGSMAAASLLPLANGVAFDVSIPRVAFLIRNDMPMGVVLDTSGAEINVSPARPTRWPVEGSRSLPTDEGLRGRALGSLLAGNIVPAFERVLERARVSPKLLWATAAEQIDSLYENARGGHDRGSFEPFERDRRAILFGARVPGVQGPNPMLDLLDWEDSDDPLLPRSLQVRRICCVCYVIPGREPAYCRTCGLLDKAERLDLWRSWLATIEGEAGSGR
jgi:ferric iron reductase protein FhuF